MIEQPEMIPKTITSKDGGSISYYQTGKGPGLIFVHGGMETWRSHTELAEALSSEFEIYLPDRRGRGLSSPLTEESCLQTELDDLESLVRETGARFAFSVSSGALITLQLALKSPSLWKRIALYEPPLMVDKSRLNQLVARFRQELEDDDIASALITGIKVTQMEPLIIRSMPRFLLRPLISWFMSRKENEIREKRESVDGEEPDPPPMLRDLVPTMKLDFKIVDEMHGTLQMFTELKETRVLLISGTASQSFLINSCVELQKVIPEAKHVRLKGLDHLGSGNKEFDGHPDVVAKVIREFYTEGKQ
jgi:pimeloyl-ACP methyl ester carboxylesterase